MSKKAVKIRQDKERSVVVKFSLPCFGNEEQAINLARRATKDLAVRMSTTLTGTYKSQSFTYDRSGRSKEDPDFEEWKLDRGTMITVNPNGS
jgi:hypothetical protein